MKMFIENKTRGTELQSLDYDASTGVAVVELRNSDGNSLFNNCFLIILLIFTIVTAKS